jgi:hypothetical protein
MVLSTAGWSTSTSTCSASADPTNVPQAQRQGDHGAAAGGDYTIVVDSYAGDVPGGAAGEYMLVVLAD